MALKVQVRDRDGRLRFFGTIEEAVDYGKEYPSIWKISWTDSTTGERIRLVREFEAWVYWPISLNALLDAVD